MRKRLHLVKNRMAGSLKRLTGKTKRRQFGTSTRDKIQIKQIKGTTLKITNKGKRLLKSHPEVYKLLKEIISSRVLQKGILDPESETPDRRRELRNFIQDLGGDFGLREAKPPYFIPLQRVIHKDYLFEEVLSPHGNINIGLFRITSKTGESVLVKVQPQHHFTSNVEQLEMVRKLGHRTPEYYVEFDFPKFNVQVLRTMKLPNMEQLNKRNPTEYKLVKKQFDKEVEKLRRAHRKKTGTPILDFGEKNCLVRTKRINGKIKAYFYWIDLII